MDIKITTHKMSAIIPQDIQINRFILHLDKMELELNAIATIPNIKKTTLTKIKIRSFMKIVIPFNGLYFIIV